MAFAFRFRFFCLLALATLLTGSHATAQVFGLGATTATNAVTINSSVLFTINLTNLSAFQLAGVFVTNSLSGSASAHIVGFAATQGTVSTNSSTVIFNLDALAPGGIAQMTVTARPATSGTFSNRTTVIAFNITNTASTNIVIQVAPPVADLALTLRPPPTPVLVNDWITYGLTVTNSGTNTASSVTITNSGFTNMNLIGISPPTQTTITTNGNLIFNLGSLAGGAGRNFEVTVQPTNAGVLTLSASVTATNITESNVTNNTASTNITVEEFVTGELIATNVSAMTFNPQTGLMEQTVRLANFGTNSAASARVIVLELTNRLFNAVGTNSGNPFVVYATALDPGQSVDLLMEYFVPTGVPITIPNSNYTAVASSAVNLATSIPSPNFPPPNVPAPNFRRIISLGTNGMLIEFDAILDRSYTILYSADATFTNPITAQPPITAPANRVQWIDHGPPKTISHPASGGMRFYRVMLNP